MSAEEDNGLWCNSNPRLVRGVLGGPRPTSVSSEAMTRGTVRPHLGVCSLEAGLNLSFTRRSLAIGLLKAD